MRFVTSLLWLTLLQAHPHGREGPVSRVVIVITVIVELVYSACQTAFFLSAVWQQKLHRFTPIYILFIFLMPGTLTVYH